MQLQMRPILLVSVLAVLAASACGRPQTGGRRLLNNPIYTESHKLVGPETHRWNYFDAPAPAVHSSDVKVRSEKPYVDIQHTHSNGAEGKGGHKVDTWEGAKLTHNVGKGVDFAFNSGTRAFALGSTSVTSVPSPQTAVVVDGGMPLAVDHLTAYEGGSPNSTGAFALGSGPTFNNAYNLTAGAGQLGSLGHHGR